jgi:D-tyrosyl-tRNA(Tyr) deacylase
MKVVIQRVQQAAVTIQVYGSIQQGYLILLGISPTDTVKDVQWLAEKIIKLRIFNDTDGKMNLSIRDVDGAILLVSQFTLYAQCHKGNRLSYVQAAKPVIALPLYEQMIIMLESLLGKSIAKGVFGADMQISLVNDGPITIIIDSKQEQ